MKVTSSDILAILRRFNLADETNVPKNIDQIKSENPSPTNQLVSFRFGRQKFHAVLDETAEDDKLYIINEINKIIPDAVGELLQNPTSELTTYGLPFKGKDVYLFQQNSHKKRLDVLLAEKFPATSRSTWQKHIKAGHVQVNSQPAKSAKQEVTEADHIAISLPEKPDHLGTELPVIYLDDNVIVIDKPAGVLTHSKGALNDEFTVADFFRRYTTVGLDTNRPGIVHRLDRDTSGVMIGARTPEAFDLLKSQFADRKVKKSYTAVVQGTPKNHSAKIDIPIGRNPNAPSTFRADKNGKPAITEYALTESRNNKSLVDLWPLTGRTHQLRVHLAFLGTPIVGDRVYGKDSDRLYLHAKALEITIPFGIRKTFVSKLPSSFLSELDK